MFEFPVFDYRERGKALYLKPCRSFRLFINMEFADLAIVSLLCDFRCDRTYHTAGTAPDSKEIEKNGFLGIQNFVCEIFFTNFITDISVSSFCFYYIRFQIRVL